MDDSTFSFKDWSHNELINLRSAIRSFYRSEQKGICSYCRKNISLQSANNCQVEHIAPKSLYRNFIFEPKNLCVICADCNEIKREQETLNSIKNTLLTRRARKSYPRSTNSFKCYHPHFDNYSDHIEIVGDYFYVDKSKKGHFTIGVCRLNRKLYEYGWEKEIVDDKSLVATMSEFLKSKSTIKKATLLNKLRHQIINI